MNISATQLKQQTHLLDHVKEEDIVITKRDKPFAVVVDIDRYKALIHDAEQSKRDQKLQALSLLGTYSLGGKGYAEIKAEMGNG